MGWSVVVKIAASILSADFTQLGKDVTRAEEGGADIIHIDVMDGHFVPNLGIGPMIIKKLRTCTQLPFGVHLMVEEPNRFIQPYVESGANFLLPHVETLHGLYSTIQTIKASGLKSGIALNPSTPLSQITDLLPMIDILLVMTVEPGFGGQSFIPQMLTKIAAARKVIDTSGFRIELAVDGGINAQTAPSAVEAGADLLIMGSAIFGNRRIEDNLKKIRRLVS
jgi:ribulose-phosphate 3-epimerase